MDLVIAPAVSARVHTWRLPHGWPLLSFGADTGRLVVVRLDHLSPGEALRFASALARAAEVLEREVRGAVGEGAAGWARRAGGPDGKPDATDAHLVYPEDPPRLAGAMAHIIAHEPRRSVGRCGSRRAAR